MAFCHACLKAVQYGILSASKADPAFTVNGFCNWKNATDKKKGFHQHEMSEAHMEAVTRYVTAPGTALGDVGELLSKQHVQEKSKNRKVLLMMLSNIRYLARQALPLRGNWDVNTATEENSNFHQLLKLRAEENPKILEWLQRKGDKYTSPEIQNEMLKALALGMLREISEEIRNAKFYTINGRRNSRCL